MHLFDRTGENQMTGMTGENNLPRLTLKTMEKETSWS